MEQQQTVSMSPCDPKVPHSKEMNEAPPLDIGVSVQKGRHRKLAHTTRAILVQVSEIGSSEPNGQSMRDN